MGEYPPLESWTARPPASGTETCKHQLGACIQDSLELTVIEWLYMKAWVVAGVSIIASIFLEIVIVEHKG